ncbi:Transposase [bioreactor metagenome]|uniref:Transposase n=1 Tax=bioreactor metagenome TaxID=1076179 RepID=A0A645HJE6_9ZZZZ
MLYCGLRPGETIPLCWKDIDFDKKRINVTAAKESGSDKIKEPKTKAGIRSVPIPSVLMSDFEKAKGGPFDPLFTKENSNTMHTEESMKCMWKSFKKELDISMGAKYDKVRAKDGRMRTKLVLSVVAKDLTPYCLRHTYCTDLEVRGVPINVAKVLMGHSDISVTGNIYTHITDETIDAAAKLINGENNGNDNGKKIETS